jgi:hypothetical protein
MKIQIENIYFEFPIDFIYPEQIQIIFLIKKILDKNCHGLMGIPLGSEISLPLINFFFSYKNHNFSNISMVYCTQKKTYINTILNRMKLFGRNYFKQNFNNSDKQLISGLTEKKELCLNSKISNQLKENQIVDFCNSLVFANFIEQGNHEKREKPHCFYFSNFKKYPRKFTKGVWSINKYRKEGLKHKICPYFFSKRIILDSDILFTDAKHFFLPENYKNYPKRYFSNSFLFLENLFDTDCLILKIKVSKIDLIIINDSRRNILLLKKKLFYLKKNFQNFFEENNNKKNIQKKIKPFENLYCNFKIKISKNFYYYSIRNYHLIEIFKIFVNFITDIFKRKGNFDCSIESFFFLAFDNKIFLGYTLEDLNFLNTNVKTFLSKLGFFQERILYGLFRFTNFLSKIGIFFHSSNQNTIISYFKNSLKSTTIFEPSLSLFSLDIGCSLKKFFEVFRIVLVVVHTPKNTKNLSFLLDYRFKVFGDLNGLFKKKFFGFSGNERNVVFKNLKKKKCFFKNIKNFDFIINKIFKNFNNGTLLFFSSIFQIEEIVRFEKKIIDCDKIFQGIHIFVESNDVEFSIVAFHDYKLSCDLGFKSVFFGLYGGILFSSTINIRYRQTIFFFGKFPNPYYRLIKKVKNKVNYVGKKFFLPKLYNFLLSIKTGFFINYFFRSKADSNFYFFLNLEQNFYQWNLFFL